MSRPPEATAQPPSSYAPQAVQDWFASAVSGTRVSRMDAFRNDARRLENLELHLELDTAQHRFQPTKAFLTRLADLTGTQRFEPHLEVPVIMDLVAEALARARFHGVVRIEVDGEALFSNNERTKDLRNTILMLVEASHRATRCDTAIVSAIDDEFGDTKVVVTVKRMPKKNEHSLQLRFEGEVPEADFRALLGHLKQGLPSVYVSADGAS